MRLLRILKPGVRTTCQDTGRFGYEAMGIGTSGAADPISYHLLNWLLGNPRNTPVLEIILGGFQAEILHEGILGIAGAHMHATLNHHPLRNWSRFHVHKGDTLRFGHAREGQIAYLGTPGGFACERLFGSVSVNPREGIGRPTAAGDEITVSRSTFLSLPPATLSESLRPDFSGDTLRLRYLPGYQVDWFDRNAFESATFTITPQHDKMGCRLTGTPLLSDHTALISEGISYGAIQITHEGDPIVLLGDRQTLGGYPKIGTVLPIDGYRLVQYGSGTRIHFEPVTIEAAQRLLRPQRLDAVGWFPYGQSGTIQKEIL